MTVPETAAVTTARGAPEGGGRRAAGAMATEASAPEVDGRAADGAEKDVREVDVLIVGAGISGIGAAWRLAHDLPDHSFMVVEKAESFGGTWLTHRYPGVRSDSDLYTFGYSFKPWLGAPIATAGEIRAYMGEVIAGAGLERFIHYGQRVEAASWSSAERRWTVTLTDLASGGRRTVRARFLWMCQGYYRHEQGYTPEWPGMERFAGRFVHPQAWPEDLDPAGKRVVLIGSGATAATLAPALAGRCAALTMLQRSPSYYITGRNANELADLLRELEVDETWIHEIVRRKALHDQHMFARRARAEPDAVRAELLANVAAHLQGAVPVEPHFTPSYRPWRQRVAFVPDGDFFAALRRKEVEIVTGEIDSFCEEGVRLKSGETLAADVVVTATGFNLSVLGDVNFVIDGAPLDFASTVAWRGMMFTGVPNMAWIFGYFRASWTLRVDIVADFICRLLQHMRGRGAQMVTPSLRKEDVDMPLHPFVNTDDFNPGYVLRGLHLLPKQGDRGPWRHSQDYWRDREELPAADLDCPSLQYA